MTLAIEQPTFAPRPKRWTKQEYNRLVDHGAFQGQRVCLFRGELIEMPPTGALHAKGVSNLTEWLVRALTPEYRIRIQSPIELGEESVPEPDAAVITHVQFKRRPHPNHAELLVEVSDSSLDFDHEKAFDYAAARVPEYWILNVRDRELEVFRQPVADPKSPSRFRYQSHQRLPESETVSPLAEPPASVKVAELLEF